MSVEAAADMYRETIAWRESYNLKQVMSDYGTGEERWMDSYIIVTKRKVMVLNFKNIIFLVHFQNLNQVSENLSIA